MSRTPTSFEQRVQDRQDAVEAWVRQTSPRVRGLASSAWPAVKPEEFRRTSIVCGIGLMVLGAIGFLILLLMDTFPWLIHDVFNIPSPGAQRAD